MSRKKSLGILILLSSLFSFAEAAPQEVNDNSDATDASTQSSDESSSDQAGEQKEEPQLKPTGDIKKRKLSTAFEQFQPSESISADNAVPFPVDI